MSPHFALAADEPSPLTPLQPLAYFYFVFLCMLLFDRARRDCNRNKSKYGKYWDEYCKLVPYKIIPYVY